MNFWRSSVTLFHLRSLRSYLCKFNLVISKSNTIFHWFPTMSNSEESSSVFQTEPRITSRQVNEAENGGSRPPSKSSNNGGSIELEVNDNISELIDHHGQNEEEELNEAQENYEEESTANDRVVNFSNTTPISPPKANNFTSPRRRAWTANPPPDNETVNAISNRFMNGERVNSNDPELLATVVLDLEEKRDQLIMDGSFSESMKAQRAIDTAKIQQFNSSKRRVAKERLDFIQSNKRKVQEEYDQVKNDFKEKEIILEEKIKEQYDTILQRQSQEIDAHDNEWGSTKQRQFNRASQKLRNLRTQQRQLINTRRFDEAQQVCKIADNLKCQESAEMNHQFLTAFKASRSQLERKLQDEMEAFFIACETKRNELQIARQHAEKPYINRLKLLESEEKVASNPDRYWVLKHRNDGDLIANCATKTRSPRPHIRVQDNVAEYNLISLSPLPKIISPKKKRSDTKIH